MLYSYMASNLDFVEFVCEQIDGVGIIRNKKMFGEYGVWCNEKLIILICDDTAFVKILPETTALLGNNNQQKPPYKGAKPYYVVDVDNKEQMTELARVLEKITPVSKKKK